MNEMNELRNLATSFISFISFISFTSFASQCVSRPIYVIKSTLGVALVWVSCLIKA